MRAADSLTGLRSVRTMRMMRRRRQRGIALLLVLWAIALLALLVAQMIGDVRLQARVARLRVNQTQGELAAQGGLALAVAGLSATRPGQHWIADGRPYAAQVGTARLTIRSWSEKGKVDLNVADGTTLRRLFVCAGASEESAQRIATEIQSWRTANNATANQVFGINAASDRAYQQAGRVDGPMHAPLTHPETLRQMLDMTTPLFHAVSGAVTVWSGEASIYTEVASPLALCAARGTTLEAANALVARRWQSNAAGSTDPGPVVEVVSTATLPNGASTRLSAVLMLTGGSAHGATNAAADEAGERGAAPYLILDWNEA